jgi:membrane associated rhomboid family serine protease
VYSRRTTTPPYGGGGGFSGLTGPIPRDLLVLFGVLFATFSLYHLGAQFFIETYLLLTPAVWQGYVWQMVTYPFMGIGGFFFLIGLIFLYMFARDVFYGLGRRHFWRLIFLAAVGAALVALLVDRLMFLANWRPADPFTLMQGQSLLWALIVAAYATANWRGTIYLIFLPIEGRWFLALTILFAFVGFVFTKDFAGFVGICTAVAIGYWYIRSSGKVISLRELRLRLERRWIQWKLDRNKRKRGFRVISGEGKRGGGDGEVRKGPWVH